MDTNSAEPFLGVLGLTRHYVRELYMEVSPDTGGTMLAMVLGEKSELPDERQQLYLDSGIGHILSLSGLHLSLLGVGLYGVLRKKMTVSTWPAAILVGTLLLVYLRLIGSGISATRAAIAIVCSLIAGGLGKTYDSPSAAALGMLIILHEYPLQIAHPSFWLSFGAVLSLGLIMPELARWLKPRRKWTKTLLSVLVVWLALMPVTAINQYVVQPYSILLNFVVVPLMSPVLLNCILVLAVAGVSLPAGAVISVPVRLAFSFVDELCRLAQKIPGNQIIVGCPSYGQLLVYVGVFAVFLFVLCRQNRLEWEQQEIQEHEESETGGEQKVVRVGQRKRWCVLCVVSTLLATILLFGIGRNRLEIVFLDVGQGDGIFLRMPNGATMMVDGGSSSEEAVCEQVIYPSLKWAGVRKLDYLVMTHLDSDHMNGLVDLLESGFPVGCLLVSEVTMDEIEVEGVEKVALENNTKVVRIGSNDSIKFGKVEIGCVSPSALTAPQTENECSVVLELKYRRFSCLLTGDVEGKGERAVEEYVRTRPAYTLLKVAHHGSKYSTSEAFLAAVRPAAAVISCGEKNSYGHPHEELLDRLEAVGSDIYCTAECGAVMVNTNGIRWEIKGFE
jgi:competence protein ComEC